MGMNVDVIFFLQIIELKPRKFGGVNNIYLSKPFNAFCTSKGLHEENFHSMRCCETKQYLDLRYRSLDTNIDHHRRGHWCEYYRSLDH